MRHAVIGTLLAVMFAMRLAGQGDAPLLIFEVSSVKPSPADATGMLISGPAPAEFRTRNAPLDGILRYAFGLRDDQIVGLPGWARTDRFDIVGKYPSAEARGRVAEMVRALLLDRFKLKAHEEMRDGPAYALVKSRSDGRLGSQLRKAQVEDCAAYIQSRREAGQPTSFGGGPGEKAPPCMAVQTGDARDRIIMANSRTMTQFAGMVSSAVGRTVIDRTELMGLFDVELRWTPEVQPASSGEPATARLDDAISIFTALQEQLGLKLEPTRGPMKVLVVESVERPTPD
jgi:uncharacterized protein (TIGR03435 family)